LRDFLLKRFAVLPQDEASAMRRRAGAACLAVSDYYQAARFFMEVSDYDAILAMPFTDQYFFNNQEYDIIQFLERIFQECPPEILLKYPLTISAVGIQFYKKGMREQYDRVVKLLTDFCANPPDLPKDQFYRIKGEFEMMLFFSRFNGVAKMGEHHKKGNRSQGSRQDLEFRFIESHGLCHFAKYSPEC
jgi:LuxR family maltose regulon positive regulatory protein